MLLRERLERLGRPARPHGARSEADLSVLARGLDGEVRENGWGPYVVVEQVLPMPPGLQWNPLEPGWLAGGLQEPLEEGGLCFFDTETTGLNGGVGNHAFLVALAWRMGSSLLMRQYVLPDPGLELPFLEAISADMGASGALVSYNGKTFDVPVLEGRLLLSRRSSDCLRRPHLDLLHPSRRLFKARLGACNLQNVEQMVLGRDRGEDIPGFLIPEMYFNYLRHRDPAVLREVLAHNRQDVVSLSLLLDHLVRCLREESGAHPLDRFGAARLLEAVGQPERALTVYGGLWEECGGCWDGEVWPGTWTPIELAYVVGLRLATMHRRRGALEEGEEVLSWLWRRHPRAWEAAIMLAKHLEHRRKDRVAAAEVVGAAIAALETERYLAPREEKCLADLRRRAERLAVRTVRTRVA
ncbi:MAG: ribonuclease H-like domain-containing protein [Candidatus Dormibacteria bacterium]